MDIFFMTLFVVVCVLLIIVVLLQKGRGGGLGAAFGGAGSSAFGTRTGDVFTWVTIVLTAMFLLLAVGASFVYRTKPGTVFTPVFEPRRGPIKGPTEVKLLCGTPGAAIHYTTDGSDPTRDSPAGAVVTVSPGTTLKAKAFRAGWNPSDTVQALYEADESATRPAPAPATAPEAERPGGPETAPATPSPTTQP